MITIQDSQNLIKLMKEEFATKDEFRGIERKFDNLLVAVDGFMKRSEKYDQEMIILGHNVSTIKNWMRPVSAKTGVDYPF